MLACTDPLALIANLPDSSLTADSSAVYMGDDSDNLPIHSRLQNTETGIGGWLTGNTGNPWIQADLLSVYYVSAVATQGRGRHSAFHWVTRYTLSYGFNALAVQNVLDEDGNTKVFSGNSNRDTVVRNTFFPVRAQIMRIIPTAWNGSPTLRWELYGCFTGNSALMLCRA